ncbi:AraC family transcriptional regulator [Planococcus halocryophilus]|uniref:AraC family transcriptional regulator n=1 Tax=Planococcus halocryophilus TaxID=1215089 RepID=UPI001F0EECCF|nr:AraC family transcriptional regulator [Planococcus halocryophilus]MCH4827238.1 AraC family transcriptional regulator [Planococcus halocryophilus]
MTLAPDSFLFHSIQSFSVPYGTSQHVPLHRHADTVEMLLVLSGTVQCKIDGQVYTAPAGTVLFIQAGSWHEQLYTASDKHCGYRLSFCPVDPTHYAEFPPVIPIDRIDTLKTLFIHLQQEKQFPRKDSKQMTHHVISSILLHVYRSAGRQESHNYLNSEETIQEVKHYMEENHSKPLTLAELATRFNLTKYQLARLFKEITGMSPLQYIISCRITTAKHLLRTSDSSVSKIAVKIGYKSNTQFQAAFKAVVGVTPRQYRVNSK